MKLRGVLEEAVVMLVDKKTESMMRHSEIGRGPNRSSFLLCLRIKAIKNFGMCDKAQLCDLLKKRLIHWTTTKFIFPFATLSKRDSRQPTERTQ